MGGDEPTEIAATAAQSDGTVRSSIGPYRILQVLGAGGMGVVYLAEQRHPIQRRVAVKVIKLGMATSDVLARFESERQALALMNHPNVAKVFDAGTDEIGRPYFVMEYVPGVSITEYCDKNRLKVKERLQIFLQVCSAVQHAHQKGIIHRDIKPSNVLVAVEDSGPVPKVIDFGVAKATNQRLTEKTLFTEHGILIGTPGYMSPEQAEVTNLDVSTTSDIYSLGILLYELLIGVLPFDTKTLREAGFDEMRRIIREGEPPRPTFRLKGLGIDVTEVLKRRQTDLASLTRQLRGDLEWITLKAIEKDPTHRYAAASEFAADIRRHLSDEPVAAGPPTFVYRLQKFARRNRRFVVSASAVVLALLLGLIVSTTLYFNVRAARNEAEWQSYAANLSAADSSLKANDLREARRHLELCPPPLRGWEWSYLAFVADSSIARLGPLSKPIIQVGFSPDNQRIIAETQDELHVWNRKTMETIAVYKTLPAFDKKSGGPFRLSALISVSRDGRYVVSEDAQFLSVRESLSGKVVASFKEPRPGYSATFGPDGNRILSSSVFEDALLLWDATSGNLIRAFSPSKRNSSSAFQPNSINAREVNRMDRDTCCDASDAFTPDSSKIVHGSRDNVLRVWDVGTGQLLHELSGHEAPITTVDVSPNGSYVASGSVDKSVRIWNVTKGSIIRTLTGHEQTVQRIAFGLDSSKLASASGKTIRIWENGPEFPQPALVLAGHDDIVQSLSFSSDGTTLISGSADKTVRLWDTLAVPFTQTDFPGLAVSSRVLGSSHYGEAVAFSPDGHSAIALGRLLLLDSLKVGLKRPLNSGDVTAVAFDPRGTRLAIAESNLDFHREESSAGKPDPSAYTVTLWNSESGKALAKLSGHKELVSQVSFTPDGRRIITASWDKSVRIWDADSGSLIRTLSHSQPILALAVSVDGEKIATGSLDSTIQLWDLKTGMLIRSLSGHGDAVTSLSFAVDDRLVSSSKDHTIRAWNARSGKLLAVLRDHDAAVNSVAWSPDGKRIISGSADSTVRLWDTERYQNVLTLRASDSVSAIAVSPSGDQIFAITSSGIALWHLRNPPAK